MEYGFRPLPETHHPKNSRFEYLWTPGRCNPTSSTEDAAAATTAEEIFLPGRAGENMGIPARTLELDSSTPVRLNRDNFSLAPW